MASEELFGALEAAVEQDPDNRDLRVHLAGLLTDAARYGRALFHAEAVLAVRPDDVQALRVAATAAEMCGSNKATSYRRLATALDPEGATESDTPPSPSHFDRPSAQGQRPDRSDEGVSLAVPDMVEDLIDLWGDDAPIEPEVGMMSRPNLMLADVGGMADVKERLNMSFLAPMRNPELAAAFAKSMGGGLLMWGPPGCGKTYLARACAGELGANFYTVGLSDVLDMYVGSSERNLTAIFEVARRNTPCLLFFDEIDALGQKRTNLRGSGALLRGVVNQFLTELDGVGKDNDGVFVLGATNHPWDVDSALLRPGRFDRMMLVLPPDLDARLAILQHHLDERPTADLDLARIAASTDGFSGADLALVCESATESAMADSLTKGAVRPIGMSDFKAALKDVSPSTQPWLETARNFALYSNRSGTFDELLAYLKRR